METLDPKPAARAEPDSPADADREQARERLQERRDFGSHVVAYVVAFNAFLIVVWAVTGAGYFWPAWVLAGWGGWGAGAARAGMSSCGGRSPRRTCEAELRRGDR